MKLPKEEFDKIFSKVPRLCVEVLIETEPFEFVLSKRLIEPFKGMWHIPGGTVQYGERLKEAVQRVAKEEIGIEVNISDMIDTIEYVNSDNVDIHAISFVFLCHLKNEKQFRGSFQAEEIKTFNIYDSIENLPDNMIPAHKEFLIKLREKC